MTTEPALASPAPRGRSLAAKFAIAFVLGAVLVVGVGSASLYAYGQQYTGRVLPGVQAGGVDVSGLTPGAATAAVAEDYRPWPWIPASCRNDGIAVAGFMIEAPESMAWPSKPRQTCPDRPPAHDQIERLCPHSLLRCTG
jgi:hypothetical protein